MCATIAECHAECLAEDDRPSIGQPIPNTQVPVLDQDGHAVPLGVFKTTSMAHAFYRPGGKIAAPVALFLAEELPLRAPHLEQRAAGWGWDLHTTGGLQILRVPGNHVNMLNEPQVSDVARQMQALLA